MRWHGGHLHEFVVGRMHYGIPDDDWPNQEPFVDERRVRLNTLVESGARRFTFVYDFGDGWEHTVKVEDLVTTPKEASIMFRCRRSDLPAFFGPLITLEVVSPALVADG